MIYHFNLILTLLIYLHNILFIKKYKIGFISKELSNDEMLLTRINKRIFPVLFIITFFYLIFDFIFFLFIRKIDYFFIFFVIKITVYKIFELYYRIKIKKQKRDYYSIYPRKKQLIQEIGVILIGLFLVITFSFLHAALSIILVVIYISIILFINKKPYIYWNCFLKIGEIILLFTVFFLIGEYNTLIKYLPVAGLILIF